MMIDLFKYPVSPAATHKTKDKLVIPPEKI